MWTIEIDGTSGSITYTTKLPKTLRRMEYGPGGLQEWRVIDIGSHSAYPTITGAIFESGFSDAILQILAWPRASEPAGTRSRAGGGSRVPRFHP
jgi:hypothetical protein